MMLLKELESYKIFLASKSPRRLELLAGMGIDFERFDVNVEENYPSDYTPVQVAEYLSQLKLSPINVESFPRKTIFIACDTIVVLDQRIIEKPADEEEAVQMLHALSGKTHVVISGLTVATPSHRITTHRKTEVRFSHFSDEDIKYYVAKYKPLDKAGAYGCQEWLGYVGIDSINGSFYNVMGLPTKLLWDVLAEIIK